MNTARLNITLPKEVAELLSGVKNKSSYIAEAIKMGERGHTYPKYRARNQRPFIYLSLRVPEGYSQSQR